MSFTSFYMQTTASNLNAGSTAADAAVYSSPSGNWDGTSVFTPTDGQTTTSLVSVGDWVSVYNTGATAAVYVAQVTAVGAGTNGTITLSTTAKLGTAPTSNSGSRNAKAGGAWADLGVVTSLFTSQTIPSSFVVNVKAGTYANTTTTRAFAAGGSATALLMWRGYKTTPGDQETNWNAVAGTDIPSITYTTGQQTAAGARQVFESLAVSGAATAGSQWVATGAAQQMLGCRVTSTGANSASRAYANNAGSLTIAGCYFSATTTAAICLSLTSGNGFIVSGCTVSGGAIGISLSGTNNTITGTVVSGQTGDCANVASAVTANFANCSFYIAASANGISNTTSAAIVTITNCYFEGAGGGATAGINNTTGTNTDLMRAIGCAYYNCTNNTVGLTESLEFVSLGTVASAGFTNGAGGNFAPTSVLKNVGYPGTFENVTAYQSYPDVGAVRHQDPSGGGLIVRPGMIGGFNQ